MGKYFTDQYSLLHFAVGIIAYFWGMSFKNLIIIHTLFEILENTVMGMKVINDYITYWPGGKSQSDEIINRVGDTVFAGLGWIVAKSIDIEMNRFNKSTLLNKDGTK